MNYEIFTQGEIAYVLLSYLIENRSKNELAEILSDSAIGYIKTAQKNFEYDLEQIAKKQYVGGKAVKDDVANALDKLSRSVFGGFPFSVFMYRIQSDASIHGDWFYKDFWKYWNRHQPVPVFQDVINTYIKVKP